MKAPGFRSHPSAYDRCRIGGLQVPGEWSCDEFERELKLTHPKGSGDDGGPASITGLKEDSEFTITTKLHTDQDEADWEVFCAKNMPIDNQGKRGAQTIENVQAARLGVRKVVVRKIGESKPRGGDPIVGKIVCRVSGTKSGKAKKVDTGSLSFGGPVNALKEFTLLPINEISKQELRDAVRYGPPSPADLIRRYGR